MLGETRNEVRPSPESVSNPGEAEAVVSAETPWAAYLNPNPCHPCTEAGARGLALTNGCK